MAKDDQYTPKPKVQEEIKTEVLPEAAPEAAPEVPTAVINDESKPVEEAEASTIPPTD